MSLVRTPPPVWVSLTLFVLALLFGLWLWSRP
jgi:hypothetical protein